MGFASLYGLLYTVFDDCGPVGWPALIFIGVMIFGGFCFGRTDTCRFKTYQDAVDNEMFRCYQVSSQGAFTSCRCTIIQARTSSVSVWFGKLFLCLRRGIFLENAHLNHDCQYYKDLVFAILCLCGRVHMGARPTVQPTSVVTHVKETWTWKYRANHQSDFS